MKKILVIEDNTMIRENILELLELAGYHAEGACDGIEGLEKGKRKEFDLILCDVMMPGLSGYEVFDALAQETSYDTPFIFISASVEKKMVQAALDRGVKAYIRKPFEEELLLETIKAWIKNN